MDTGRLTDLAARLRADLPIDALERLERELKDQLAVRLARPVGGADARELALFQRDLGFLLKYKSYAIKAASPLGYSVFLQQPGEGFSFQRHVRHKTEIFYVLDVLPGGYVFICESDEWERMYRRDTFEAWLAGAPGLAYDRFRYEPQPGDVVVIDKLNVVHTVVGCTLAEFATVSTDMVDRLHDQNAGHPVPSHFSREYAESRLRAIVPPSESHHVVISASGVTRTPMPRDAVAGGWRTTIGAGSMGASTYVYEPGAAGAVSSDPTRATCLHVMAGKGSLVLGTADEVRRTSPPTIAVSAGDLLLVAPGAHYGMLNDGCDAMTIAEHRLAADTAFVA